MRVQVLALLLLLLLAATAAAEYYGGERKIAVSGSEVDIGKWIDIRYDMCMDTPEGYYSVWSQYQYSRSGVKSAATFQLGLVYDFRVETGIPRVDQLNQRARVAFGQVAASWADPNPLDAHSHALEVSIDFGAPSGWEYETTRVYVECRIYNATSGKLVGYWSDSASFVTRFRPTGWRSGGRTCEWGPLDEAAEFSGECIIEVPWYGKNEVSPGDFGAQYWNTGVKPKPEAFGEYYVFVDHQWPKTSDGKFAFYMMSGLKRGDVNKNSGNYTKDAKVKPEYLDYVWYITGGSPAVKVRFGPGSPSALSAVFEESLLQRWVGDEYYRHNRVPEPGSHGYLSRGIPVFYSVKARLLPPLWASAALTAPRSTVPEIRHVLFTLAEIRGEPYTFFGLNITEDGYCRIHGLKSKWGWAPTEIRTPADSSWAHEFAALALGFSDGYPGVRQVVVMDIVYKKFKNCTGVAYAVVVNVPNGVARTYVDGQPLTLSLREAPWLVPFGGIGRVKLGVDFEYTWLGQTVKPPLSDKGGIEAIERRGGEYYITGYTLVDAASVYFGIHDSFYIDFMAAEQAADGEAPNYEVLDCLIVSPWRDVAFGDREYKIKTPVGELTVVSPLMKNWPYPWTKHSYGALILAARLAVPSYMPTDIFVQNSWQ